MSQLQPRCEMLKRKSDTMSYSSTSFKSSTTELGWWWRDNVPPSWELGHRFVVFFWKFKLNLILISIPLPKGEIATQTIRLKVKRSKTLWFTERKSLCILISIKIDNIPKEYRANVFKYFNYLPHGTHVFAPFYFIYDSSSIFRIASVVQYFYQGIRVNMHSIV